MSDLVLVTGAGGAHGGTGAHLVRGLLAHDIPVRVLVRRETATSTSLAAAGADVVIGDLHDRRTLTPALEGVTQAYFTYPIAEGVLAAAANWSEAIRTTSRPIRTVVMSMAPAHPDHPSPRGRDQWLAEQVMRWAGLDVLVLRVMALFHENLEILHATTITTEGVIRNAFGPGQVPWISGADAAEIALAAFLRPHTFTGDTARISGTESASHTEIATMTENLLGRPIHFTPVDAQTWKDELHNADPTKIPREMATHIPAVAEAVAKAGPMLPADSTQFTHLTGKPPRTLANYLAATAPHFTA
ncbi:NmrA family NAD(P)-binding protein [Umezawaea sp. NPDC059074]|uniref:NmrA family NAD(P)-binding protein n=1 Tax=Umezawaea sp. NPDC059074 TaxID=3346716 RepID=UPI003673DA37